MGRKAGDSKVPDPSVVKTVVGLPAIADRKQLSPNDDFSSSSDSESPRLASDDPLVTERMQLDLVHRRPPGVCLFSSKNSADSQH